MNNVGMSYEYPQEFLELNSTDIDNLVNVNITSLNAMTRLVLPQMVERKNGAVINISSFSATIPTPLLSVYSASKSYVDLFSQGLAKEYSSEGITVQCVLPGHVVSNISKIKRSSLNVPSPDVFVGSALSRLGIDARTCGYWAHDIMNFVSEVVPRRILVDVVYDRMKDTKAKALKRKQNFLLS